MTTEEINRAILELADNTLMLLSDEDRQFILGLAMQLDMQIPIHPSYYQRVSRIYQTFRQNQYL